MSRAALRHAPPPPRGPWQMLYAAVLRARRRRARSRATRLDRPTLSVGNLHWGGGGKTPLVVAIANHLTSSGLRPGILSRGYGRQSRGAVLVSAGQGPLIDWRGAGDEPLLLARSAPGAVVAVAASRAAAAALARASAPIDLYLLDDAFSHVAVARDLELLAFPAADPFGGGRLAPGGRLREPLSAAAAADAVLLTGLDRPDPQAGAELAKALARHGYEGPAFAVGLDARLEPRDARGPFVLISGTARPTPVLETARRCGVEPVEHLVFRDHHDYRARSIRRIRATTERHGATALTTGKDAIKLRDRLGGPLVVLEIEARPEPAFYRWLDARIGAALDRQSASVSSNSESPPSTA